MRLPVVRVLRCARSGRFSWVPYSTTARITVAQPIPSLAATAATSVASCCRCVTTDARAGHCRGFDRLGQALKHAAGQWCTRRPRNGRPRSTEPLGPSHRCSDIVHEPRTRSFRGRPGREASTARRTTPTRRRRGRPRSRRTTGPGFGTSCRCSRSEASPTWRSRDRAQPGSGDRPGQYGRCQASARSSDVVPVTAECRCVPTGSACAAGFRCLQVKTGNALATSHFLGGRVLAG